MKYDNSIINGPDVELINLEWPFQPLKEGHCMIACKEVPGCTGIFMVYGNGDELRSCHLFNITQPQGIFINGTPATTPHVEPWLQFYNDGYFSMDTSVFISCK